MKNRSFFSYNIGFIALGIIILILLQICKYSLENGISNFMNGFLTGLSGVFITLGIIGIISQYGKNIKKSKG